MAPDATLISAGPSDDAEVAGAGGAKAVDEVDCSCFTIVFSSATSFSSLLIRSCIASGLSGAAPDPGDALACPRRVPALAQIAITAHTNLNEPAAKTLSFMAHLDTCRFFCQNPGHDIRTPHKSVFVRC